MVYMHVCVQAHTPVRVHRESRRGRQVFPITLHLFLGAKSLTGLRVHSVLARLTTCNLSVSSAQCWGNRHAQGHSLCWNLNPSSHEWVASTLPPKPFHQSLRMTLLSRVIHVSCGSRGDWGVLGTRGRGGRGNR